MHFPAQEALAVGNFTPGLSAGPLIAPRESEEVKTRFLPPYNVILLNDDFHTFDFVIQVLRKVLGCTAQRAILLTSEAHTKGRAIVWTGAKEVAELKLDQVCSCHETRGTTKLGPLSCLLEPAPGGP
jgi:ATP-dependent Clp protease adaptor protein ClpS